MQTNLKWEDVRIGDIITIELPYALYLIGSQTQLTGEVVNIRRIEQTHQQYDPLAITYFEDYLIRIKTKEKYEFPFNMKHRNKEYVIPSYLWKLINIERKENMEEQVQEQKLKVGDTVLVISNDVKRSLGFPKEKELIAEIAVHRSDGHLLIHSKQLEELELGHNGEHPQQFPNGGCWWVSSDDLQLTEKAPEFDIFM